MPDGSLSEVSLALTALTIAFAATVKAAIGLGFPLISVPIVSNFMDPRSAVILLSIPTLLSNFLIIFRGGGTLKQVQRVLVVLVALIAGTLIGARLLAVLDANILSIIVGASAIIFVSLNAARVNLTIPSTRERAVSPFIGVISGVMGGTTSIFGPILASYLHSLRLPKKEFVFSLTLLFTVGGVAQVLSYAQLGLYAGPIIGYALLACLPTAAGIYLGLIIQDRLPPRVWNVLVLVFIFLSGLNLLYRGLFAH